MPDECMPVSMSETLTINSGVSLTGGYKRQEQKVLLFDPIEQTYTDGERKRPP